MQNNTLRAESISKKYNTRKIINNISILLRRGEIVGLFGPNGAGKTTCFRIIAGLIKPDRGAVYLNDKNITKIPMYRRALSGISYLSQEPSVLRGLNVEENILVALEVIINDEDQRINKLEMLLAEFNISYLRKEKAINISGGERRRLEIARTLANDPKFILLDEPLAGIDPKSINDVKNLIKYLKQKEVGILITDHNVRDTLLIVDRAYIIYDGKVLFEGNKDAIINNKEVQNTYLGTSFLYS